MKLSGGYRRDQLTKDDLPSVNAARLRAARTITPDMTSVSVTLSDGVMRVIELAHTTFANGGSWSYFRCPKCQRRVRILRLTEFGLACWKCDGLRYRSERMDEPPDKRIARLRATLYGDGKRRTRKYGTRESAEAELRRLLIMKRKTRLSHIAAQARHLDKFDSR